MALNGKSRDEGYLDTLSEHMRQTDALFAKLAKSEHPDFLAVMAAISEMVAFYTDHDNFDACDKIIAEKLSQKKCRFCS